MFRYLCLLAGTASAVSAADILVKEHTFGNSRSGHPLQVWTIYAQGPTPIEARPGLLVVAGVEPEHRIGTSVAQRLTQWAWTDDAQAVLADTVLYVIPTVNPDGAAWLEGSLAPGRVELGRTIAPFDADRDRRIGEDGPRDLNGDGMITQMRVKSPPAKYRLAAEWIIDDADPRLMRKADVEKGERGEYALLTEGIDADGDGSIAEDGPGGPGSGINLNMNFPSHWPEFREGAGVYPLSEPESLALVRWMQGNRNITGVVILGRGDSLLNKPPTGQFDDTGRMPKGLEKADEPYHARVIETYKKHVTMDSAPAPGYEGSLLAWAYADYGAWTFESAVWSRPKVEEKSDEKPADEPAAPDESAGNEVVANAGNERDALIEAGVPETIATFLAASAEERQALAAEFMNASDEERAARMAELRTLSPEIQARVMAAVQATSAGQPAEAPTTPAQPRAPRSQRAAASSKADATEAAWLAYSDNARDGEGFVEWTKVDHPQFGRVEVGGFVPGFRINPPDAEVDRLATEQAAWITELLTLLPRVQLADAQSQQVADGLWRISCTVSNPAHLPTSSTVGLKIRQPIAVEIIKQPEDIIAGDTKLILVDRLLGSGTERHFEWLVRANKGDTINIELRSERFGTRSIMTRLTGELP